MITCTCCQNPENLIYWDYEHNSKTKIRLCYSCLKFLGWDTELKEILPKLKVCPVCKKRFTSKKPNPTKCGVCWRKFFGTPLKDLIMDIPKLPPLEQGELVAYV